MRHVFRYLVPVTPEPGAEVRLSDEDAHHLTRVVRRGPGDAVELLDPGGGRWSAEVVSAGPPATVRVTSDGPRHGAAPAVALYLGLMEWGRLDVAVEKCVELGAGALTLFTSERAGRIPDEAAWERRRARLERVAEAAARQSGRPPLGRVQGLVPLTSVITDLPAGEAFLIDPRGDAPLVSSLGAPGAPVSLVVGPAAGFSVAEVALARSAGMPVCTLGPAVLRAETAAIAAVAIAGAGRGDA